MNCKKLLALLLAALLTMALLAGCGPNAGEAITPSESQAPSETAGGETAPTSERTHVKNLVVGITGSNDTFNLVSPERRLWPNELQQRRQRLLCLYQRGQ